MELNKTETVIPSIKKLFETSCEQSIDTDFTLPDYYPEVTKVLKCITDANILSSQCSESGLSIGGQLVLTLLYAGGDDQPNSFTHVFPFTKLLDTKGVTSGAVSVIPRIGYINTKAVGPRKVEVHGSLALSVTVSGIDGCSVLSSADGEGIYTKTAQQSLVTPMETVCKSAFIEDEIQIPQSKPTVGKILRSCGKATVNECKYISGKIVVKGDVDISILYCPAQPGRPLLITERRGFSQIIDCESDSENMAFDAFARVDSLELHPKTALDGDVRNIAFEVKIGLEVMPYCTETKSFITDAFSGKYTADISMARFNAENVADSINENYVCKKKIEFGTGALNDIFDLWSNVTVDHATDEGGDILIKGAVVISILGTDSESVPVYFERPVEYEYRYNVGQSAPSFRCRPEVSVVAVNYSLDSNGGVDVSVELNIKATVFAVNTVTAVSEIKVDSDNMLPRDNDTAVILYYPENETVWNIARKYRTSPEKICEANGLESSEEVCQKILLIPNV